MYPVLFKVGNFVVYTYGLTMALGFIVAFGWVFHEARRNGENLDDYYNVCLIALIGGIVGARLLYVIVNFKEFQGSFLRMLNLREGGLVWYGGVLTVVVLIWLYTRIKKLSFYHMTDILSAPVAAGLGVGRIGCLMSGCCYGCQTNLPWGIRYPYDPNDPHSILLPEELRGVRVHPSPVYEMLAVFAIAGIVTYLNRRKRVDGQPTWIFFLLYGLARFVLEYFRGDSSRGFVFGGLFSVSQFISLILIVISIAMLWKLKKREITNSKVEV